MGRRVYFLDFGCRGRLLGEDLFSGVGRFRIGVGRGFKGFGGFFSEGFGVG